MLTSFVIFCAFICGIVPVGAQINGAQYENGLLVSSTMTNILSRMGHITILSGTPYAMIGNINITTFSMPEVTSRILSMEVDYARKRLFIYDVYFAAIYVVSEFYWQSNFENLTRNIFHNGLSRTNVRIGLDWVTGNVYWTDPFYHWIVVQSGEKTNVFKILIHENLERPVALAVDPISRFLFWSDIGSTTVKIERATLSGKDRKAIISTGLAYPFSIDVDQRDRKIVWVDADRDTLETANFDGSERRSVRRLSHSFFYDVAVFQDLVCVTDVNNKSLYIINKNTGSIFSTIQNPSNEMFMALAMYSRDSQPTVNDVCATSGCSDLCVAEGSGYLCMCREGFLLNTDNKTCSEDSGKFYRAVVWTNKTHICLTDIRVLATAYQVTECVYSQGTNITLFDIDMVERKIIFSDGSDINILDLSPNFIKTRLISTTSTVTGIAIDWRDKNVYWSESGTMGRIKIVSQATRLDYTLVDTNLIEPRNILLQPLNNHMFWISGSRGTYKFERSDLDGSSRVVIVASAALTHPISLTTDMLTDRLYFVDNGFVKSCDSEGKSLKVFNANPAFFGPIFVLTYMNYLVVGDRGYPASLKTFDKDGTSIKFSHTDLDVANIKDMKVLDANLQPQQNGPCDVFNGDCEHICLPLGRNRICHCEYGFQLDSNKETCSSEALLDNFLLVADWTHNRIYQVSLLNGEVKAVDSDTFGSPIGIVYNHITQTMLWNSDFLIHRLNFRSGEYTTLFNTESLQYTTDRFAIDYTSGNIIYTAVHVLNGLGTVAVLSPTGQHKTLIQDGSKPRAIALDPKDGLLFWTDHSPLTPFVKRANMDGTNVQTIISSGIVWPNGLAIDTKAKQLYLTDGAKNTIQRCSYSGICTVYYTDTEAHLMDIKLLGDYLYYTAWNRVYITKLHKTNPTDISRIAEKAELGRLDSLSLYSSSQTYEPVSAACSPNNGLGPCSTFCLPKSLGYSCACEDGVSLKSDGKTCENAPPTPTPTTTTTTATVTTTTRTTPSTSKTTTPIFLTTSSSVTSTSPASGIVSFPGMISGTEKPGIPVAAIGGAAAGFAVLIIVIAILVCVVVKRSRGERQGSTNNPLSFDNDFDMSSLYRDRPELETPIEPRRPDTTYATIKVGDLISFEEPTKNSGIYEKLNGACAKDSSKQDTWKSSPPTAKPNDYHKMPNVTNPQRDSYEQAYLKPLQSGRSNYPAPSSSDGSVSVPQSSFQQPYVENQAKISTIT